MTLVSLVSYRALMVFAALCAAPGCAVHYVSRGADLYDDGYYVEAAEVFERTEARLERAPSEERARYGLYRGVNFLALGDERSAARWLEFSQGELRRESGALSQDERAMLRQSLGKLAKRQQFAPEPPAVGTAVATTRALAEEHPQRLPAR